MPTPHTPPARRFPQVNLARPGTQENADPHDAPITFDTWLTGGALLAFLLMFVGLIVPTIRAGTLLDARRDAAQLTAQLIREHAPGGAASCTLWPASAAERASSAGAPSVQVRRQDGRLLGLIPVPAAQTGVTCQGDTHGRTVTLTGPTGLPPLVYQEATPANLP